MNTASTTANDVNVAEATPPRAARLAMALLGKLESGQLNLTAPDGSRHHFGSTGSQATMHLNNWRVFEAALRSGDIGFAESYIRRDWDTDNLTDLLHVLINNRQHLEQAVYGNWLGRLYHRISHLMNRNTRRGARRNIHAHYDLGNDFYSLWLDKSMTYSSALFSTDGMTLAEAQQAKYERILGQAGCQAGGSILEIGCGWGGFAEIAAASGHTLRGLTLSSEQRQFAIDRFSGRNEEDQVQFLLQDYRDESGRFDAIVSIEMFEAVGQQYWPAYFETVHRCLKPGGRAVVQTITIDDALFDRYQRGTDFIQQYIFPGGMLPSIERFSKEAAQYGLRVTDQFRFGQDYARTLQLWREQFSHELDAVRHQGFDERFVRTWMFYLSYCEAAFLAGNTDVCQFTLTRD